MTMMDDRPAHWFQPAGEISRKDMVLNGLAEFAPLEPGTVIRYVDIAGWIGEEFPRRAGEFGERSYDPMGAVADYLLAARGVLLLNVENVGYRVANDSEKVEHAERFGYSAAIARMQYGNRVLNSVDRSKVSPAQAAMAEFMVREMTEEQRVMSRKLRAERERARRWES